MEYNPREITVIYDLNKRGGREALAYAKQIAQNVNEIDISRQPLTRTQLAELMDKLNVGIDEMIDKTNELYQDKYAEVDMDENGWLEVLVHNPSMIKTPIGILGKRAIVCDLPNQILELDKGQGFDQNSEHDARGDWDPGAGSA